MIDVRAGLLTIAGLFLGAALGGLIGTSGMFIVIAAIIGALAAVGALIVSLPSVQRRYPRLRTQASRDADLRRLLGDELARCQAFTAELHPLTDQTEQIAAIEARVVAWYPAVRDALDRERPGWGASFMSNRVSPQFMSQYGDRDRVRNFLEQREAALRVLMEAVA